MTNFENRTNRPGSSPAGGGTQAHLGKHLRRVYDQMLSEPIPDRLLELVNQLDGKARDKAWSTTPPRGPVGTTRPEDDR